MSQLAHQLHPVLDLANFLMEAATGLDLEGSLPAPLPSPLRTASPTDGRESMREGCGLAHLVCTAETAREDS